MGRVTPQSRRRWAVLFLGALVVTSPAGVSAAPEQPMPSDTARAAHLLSRATFGLRASDLQAVLRDGPTVWLEAQLHPERIDDGAAAERMLQLPRLPDGASPRELLGSLVSAKLVRAVHSERQLEEVMTDFWYNHFNVFYGKGVTRYLVAGYEADAIRPHVFGRFEDMLRATARHPAMLFYLDNWSSAAPDAAAGGQPRPPQQQRQRVRGINENYARELLELHTLGVDGGYTEADVVAVARAFTGWTFRRLAARDGASDVPFLFRPAMHDRGEKVVLGRTLPAGRGVEDGEDVIRLLAAHPNTARFLATRLVARFVSDAPAPDLVEEIAAVYLRTDGDLREVTRALFTSPHFHDPAFINAKVKAPFELVASALRATGADVGASRHVLATLRALGQLPYSEPAPTGFPAMSEDWVNSGALLARMNFALDLANGRLNGVRVDARRLVPGGGASVGAMLRAIMPAAETAELEASIATELQAMGDATARERAGRALGLALGSPAFQRR